METAYLILRLSLGINIFLHGVVRIHKGVPLFRDIIVKEFAKSPMPVILVSGFATVLPFAEAGIGFMLAAGLFVKTAIVSGSVVMVLLMIGKSIIADWQTVSLQMIYIGFYASLAAFPVQKSASVVNYFFNQ